MFEPMSEILSVIIQMKAIFFMLLLVLHYLKTDPREKYSCKNIRGYQMIITNKLIFITNSLTIWSGKNI